MIHFSRLQALAPGLLPVVRADWDCGVTRQDGLEAGRARNQVDPGLSNSFSGAGFG